MTDRLFKATDAVWRQYIAKEDLGLATNSVELLRDEYNRLCGLQEALAGTLWEERAGTWWADHGRLMTGRDAVLLGREMLDAAEDRVIAEQLVDTILPGKLQAARHPWGVVEEPTKADLSARRHGRRASTRHWFALAADMDFDVEFVGDIGEYDRFDAIEDCALPPQITWTEWDRKQVVEKFAADNAVGPGSWVDMDWPPECELTTPGHVSTREAEPCPLHEEEPSDDWCEDCDEVVEEIEQHAEWSWSATARVHRLGFRSNGAEHDVEEYSQSCRVAVTRQDPGDVLIGPPGVRSY